MAPPHRTRLVVLFGGRSAEHDVSCESALQVLQAVDPARYDLVPIGITREGRWVAAAEALAVLGTGARALPSPDDSGGPELDPLPAVNGGTASVPTVVFPLVHGPMGEDGTIQGLLELAGVAYIGAGVAASALCMDKALSKRVLEAGGLPVVRWLSVRAPEVEGLAERVAAELGYPVFVKPSNMGSSVGVSRVDGPAGLDSAVTEALRYDEYVMVEEAITGREIELAVLGDESPRASLPGEVRPSRAFYDFEDKYLAAAAGLDIPARLGPADVEEVQALALAAYRALRVDGMARVDFFFEEAGRRFLVNELNTIPGFTPISMYPKLWEASGLPYEKLVDELVTLAVERHLRRSRFETAR